MQQDAAVELATWGFEVGPLRGKIPLTQHGHRNFTNDMAQVHRWWSKWPTANIGARPPAYAIVLDVDPRNDGMTTWEQINNNQPIDNTLVVRTGSGGLHVWFSLPYAIAPTWIRATAGAGIDIKTHKGYLVMPGSVHPATGEHYTVEHWCDPARLAPLPKHLRRFCFKAPPAPRAVVPVNLRPRGGLSANGLVTAVRTAPDGERNNTLNRCAYIAALRGLDIADELTQAALANGLDETEINRTLCSAAAAARGGKH
ncbi:bifunctional DNA primase/polymerase [Corynebacterium sp. HS2168-gen11]|uniref:bifunctional DNA primase/polymerase n=1 Tax=Corynebacterium sp. HS2168-gen11 TaxID=2974027 RepID=UPI0037BE2F86